MISFVPELDTKVLGKLADEIRTLCAEMGELESSLLARRSDLHDAHRQSARNLAHYLALRRHDIRQLQSQLALLGLSSLGRTESHVLSSLDKVYRVLNALLGSEKALPLRDGAAVESGEGAKLLDEHTEALLGGCPRGRRVRIMVTMATEASTDYELVRDLVKSGMDCMRINCAHDNPEIWLGMIRNLQKARQETGRSCRVVMDLAGPKLRTGPIKSGPAVIKCRPKRDTFGKVLTPVRLWLTPAVNGEPAPPTAAATLPVLGRFLSGLQAGDLLRFRDARGAQRSLRVTNVKGPSCLCQMDRTAYFVPGLQLRVRAGGKSKQGKTQRWKTGRIGDLPRIKQSLTLKEGETLVLMRSTAPGKPAVRDAHGRVTVPAYVGVTIPEFLEHAKPGEPIWFDDGKIGGVIRSVEPKEVHVEITQAQAQGEKLGASKGINLPETRIDAPALTAEDREALKFVVEHADFVEYSFVRTEADVRELLASLAKLGGESLGVVLKIETRKAFENLPKLILAAMRARAIGVMIARGDLAVECGYQRLAEIQEEILWICEAAHVPVIWATQVLESLAKKGLPSRSEITDAAMGERAECVMLNKGPHATKAVQVLDDILKRMETHQEKKRSLLRRLSLASAFAVGA
jgi:pyruvate kinase